MKFLNKKHLYYIRASFRNFVDFAKHSTIHYDAIGQFCDILNHEVNPFVAK